MTVEPRNSGVGNPVPPALSERLETTGRPTLALLGWLLRKPRFARRPGRSGRKPLAKERVYRPRRAWWGPGRWVALGVLGFLLLTLAVGAYVESSVHQRLAAAEAAADRDDPNWRLDDLIAQREVVPDGENSAKVVALALGRMPNAWPYPYGRRIPNLAASDTEASQAFERMTAAPANVRMDEATTVVLRDGLAERAETVWLARSLVDYSRGQHEWHSRPNPLEIPLTETQRSRELARVLQADVAVRAHEGDLDGALDSCCALFRLAQSIGQEPTLTSMLVRIALDGVAIHATLRVLGQGTPSDEALARVQALARDELHQPLMAYAMEGERAIHNELIRRIGDGTLPVGDLSRTAGMGSSDWLILSMSPWGKLMFDNQRAISLEWMNAAIAIARRPPSEGPKLLEAWENEVRRVESSRFEKYGAILPRLLTPAAHAAAKASMRSQAELASLVVVLAAERQRRSGGGWPASVSVGAIDTQFLSETPTDPFTGGPLHMVRREGKFVTYSVGPDGKDAQGDYDPKRMHNSFRDDIGATIWDVELRGQSPRSDATIDEAE